MPTKKPSSSSSTELLGAHVSTAGGPHTAWQRGVDIGATAIQIFTKTPNQWKEPVITDEIAELFKAERKKSGIRGVVSHDSYLINLAAPDDANRERSIASFVGELQRCTKLGVEYIVSHPGNHLSDVEQGIARNAASYAECLEKVPGDVMVLLEGTAGTGTALGSTFEELAAIRNGIPAKLRSRVGYCLDTCHLYSAGYDLVQDYHRVFEEFDKVCGLEHLRCFHLNDSKNPFDSHKDRHELIGEGSLGPEPFKMIMRDERFVGIIKVLETPKGDGDDQTSNDIKMLKRLRGYRDK